MISEVDRYLQKYAVPGYLPAAVNSDDISIVVIIPVFDEYENIRNLLHSLSFLHNHSDTLFLFVINNSSSASAEVKNSNRDTLNLFHNILNRQKNSDPLIYRLLHANIKMAFIDASSPGHELPEKHAGVGLARKIGMDAALKFFNASLYKNILVCLDADCTVPVNYITQIRNSFRTSDAHAASIYFEHEINSDSIYTPAIICYEIFLRYYVLGLRYASSPFGFHTVGSSMACTASAYIKVEGMNKRKAAEDFYFLQKLYKNVRHFNITETAVYPSSRPSSRVPFGTGQRVSRFLKNPEIEYLLYNPLSFEVLKEWLSLFTSSYSFYPDYLLAASKKISGGLFNFLVQNNFQDAWDKIVQNSKNESALSRQQTNWFDGFKTLKLIHHLRDESFPNINMFDALDHFLFKFGIPKISKREKGEIPPIEIQKEYLKILREFDLKYDSKNIPR